MSDIEDRGKVEYRVVPINRYIVTRYEENETGGSVSERGSYSSPDMAWEVAYALCKMDHERLGYSLDDERIQYPRHPNDPNEGCVDQSVAAI